MCTCIWHISNVFQYCVIKHAVVKHLGVYHALTYACISIFFLPNTKISGMENFVYDTKYCLFRAMCRVALLSQYQLSASTVLLLKPHYMHQESISIICSRCTSVPCMLLLLRALHSPVTKLFALVARKFVSRDQLSFCGFTGIPFRRIRLLVFFRCNERRSFSRCQFVSSQLNCTELLN